jgi:hypothetical protein
VCDINNTMRKERWARRFLSRSDGEEKGQMERKGRYRSEKEGIGKKRKGENSRHECCIAHEISSTALHALLDTTLYHHAIPHTAHHQHGQ